MKKAYIPLIFILGLNSCSIRQKTSSPMLQWDEKGNLPFNRIIHGLPVYRQTMVNYKKQGKQTLIVKLAEPVVVDVAKKPLKWGFFQFPSIYRSLKGDLVVAWSMKEDSAESYGKSGSGFSVSKDQGKTWHKSIDPQPLGGGVMLSNGDRIKVYTPPAIEVDKLNLPKKVGSNKEGYGRDFAYYKLDELPEKLQGVYLHRMKKGQQTWSIEHAKLRDPLAVRYTDNHLFPLVWWGDMKVMKNGDLITGIYPGYYLNNGKVDPSGVHFYRSSDQGKSWDIVGRIPYAPDLLNDPKGDKRLALGFTEPAFEILADGSYLSIFRTTDGLGYSPMYVSRSVDQGVTWSKPQVFTSAGVLPKLLQLDNGIIVLASGRPGMQLRFAIDGKGLTWTDPFEMLPFEDKIEVSCGYPELIAIGPDKFLIVYSDFRYKNEQGEIRKAIKVREVTVRKP